MRNYMVTVITCDDTTQQYVTKEKEFKDTATKVHPTQKEITAV